MQLHHLTVAEAGRAFRAGTLSPVELTRACLKRIAAVDDQLHSYIEVTGQRALAEAQAAEAELRAGHDRGPMHGIPYGLKDVFETAGVRTTGNSKLLKDNLPSQDCTVQKKLRAGGGVLLGKQTCWELAFGGPSFDLPWPPARNPWDVSRSPLGSSSGSAAAIAAGLGPCAMGSDTGGSIRNPAAVCGIAGLKPTFGRVSCTGVLPNSYTYDHAGPMARTVEDCALMLDVVAGYDPQDPYSLDAPVESYRAALSKPVKGMRIGVIRNWYEEELKSSPAVIAAMENAIEVFQRLGCVVRDVTLPTLREFMDAKTPVTLAEVYTIRSADLRERPDEFGHSLRWRIMPGVLVRAEHYVRGMRWRQQLTAKVLEQFADVDLMISAAWFDSAPVLTADEPPTFIGSAMPSLGTPFNVTGMPALALCNGFDETGLPLGMQIAGPPLAEAAVLACGHAFERATSYRNRRPAL